jgi:glutamate-1-semialdehyde 2,1-aminomutase
MTGYSQLPDGAALRRRAAAVLPASAARHGGFDELVVRGQGAYLWTADGRRLVDYFLSHGTTIVGHGDPAVNDAAALAAACCGRTGVGLQRAEVQLAEQIVAWLPSAEKVTFVTGGDEALRRAVEVSRAALGRRRILMSSIGDPGARTAFARHGHEVAAVVVAPYLHGAASAAPGSAFLEQMRELATRHGSLLVLDERETAFRHHLGGYQAIAGVTPDLTVLGEAMANGHSIGALAGRRDLIDGFIAPGGGCEPRGPHPYTFAAARATLELLGNGGVNRLHELGARLRERLRGAIHDARADATVTGSGPTWRLAWGAADSERTRAFGAAMREAGVLLPFSPLAACHVCLATSADDIDEMVAAAARAFRRLTSQIASRTELARPILSQRTVS